MEIPPAQPRAMKPARSRAQTTSPKGLSEPELELRRALAFKLRSEGHLSFRQVVDALRRGVPGPDGKTVAFDVGVSTVRADYWHVLRTEGYVLSTEEVEGVRADHAYVCEEMRRGLMPKALAGDTKAVGAMLKVLEFETRTLGMEPRKASDEQRQQQHRSSPVTVELTTLLRDPEFRREIAGGLAARVRESRGQQPT